MYGWPGLCLTPQQGLIAVASERKHHICPFGRVVIVCSSDQGATWGLPQEVYDSEMDDRHPSIAALQDGTLICSFLTVNFWMEPQHLPPEWTARAARVPDRLLDEVIGDWLIRSIDGGSTWEQVPHRMPHGGSLHGSPVPLSDGSIACFGYELEHSAVKLFFYTSGDKGESWHRIGEGPAAEPVTGRFAWMPWQLAHGKEITTTPLSMRSIVEITPGELLAVFGGPGGFLYQSISSDGGRTWSPSRQSRVWGFPPHLLKLASGAILCTYSQRRDPWGVFGVLSYDNGKTWDIETSITIDEWADKPDMGYPAAVETSPGQVIVVYYCSRQPTAPGREAKDVVRDSTPEGLLWKRFTLR